ncbi:MAG TPA: MFS transporter [Bacteroidia bacterium]|nr:MFS transporter [Bacteroidia bacterium]
MLSLVTFINRSGSMVLLFTSLYLTNELHFTIAEAGICMSFYGIGSVLGAYTGGWLTDKSDITRIMIFSLISSGCILLFILVATTPVAVSSIIFLYSFAADMFRPAIGKAMAAYSSPENRTRSVSLMRLAINLGFSVGPAMGGLLAIAVGYKWLFIIDAATSFTAGAILFFFLPKTQSDQVKKDKVVVSSASSAYKDREYLFFILMVTIYGTCFFQLIASVPQYFNKECHYSEDTIGWLMGLNGFFVVLLEMPLVTALEKKQKNIFRYIILGAFCASFSFLILQLGNGMFIWSLVFILVITMSEILCMPFMMYYSLSKPINERQGQYSALYSISYGIANIIAPIVGLGIADRFGFDVMFYFFVLVGLIAVGGFVYLKKKRGDA